MTTSKKAVTKKTPKKTKKEKVTMDFVTQEETEALTEGFKKERILQRIKKFISEKSLSIVAITVVISLITTIFLITSIQYNKNSNDAIKNKLGYIGKLRELKQSHEYYTKVATKDEMLILWIKKFSKWKYKLGGDPRWNQGDCIGAFYSFLRGMDSNVEYENVIQIVYRINNLLARKEILKRNNINEVKRGDIIIIQLEKNKPSHVGIVYDVQNLWIRFMDVNGGTLSWDLGKYYHNNYKIYGIYSMSYSFWAGDLMKKINNLQ